MGYREQQRYLAECSNWVHRLRTVTSPLCGDRRWPGSHITCVMHADHAEDGIPHESADGDRWSDVNAEEEI